MKILSWNCRGLSTPRAIPNLRKLAQEYQPDVIFLSETLSKKQKLEQIRVTLKFEACLVIDVIGRSGGIAVLWKKKVMYSVINFTRNYINMVIHNEDKGDWRLTSYHGFPERGKRRQEWDMIRDIRDMSSLPWCIIGDFNDLLSQDDKYGIHDHPNWLCVGFRQAVTNCDLTDIPLEGHKFTWIKSRGTRQVVEERLDRALANTDWLSKLQNVTLCNLFAIHSDHNSILLCCDPVIKTKRQYKFRFENCWLKEEDIHDVVNKSWNEMGCTDVVRNITNRADSLNRWSKNLRRQQQVEAAELKTTMENLRSCRDEESINRFCAAQHD